eukprot:1897202-Rhodomonas_salina.1
MLFAWGSGYETTARHARTAAVVCLCRWLKRKRVRVAWNVLAEGTVRWQGARADRTGASARRAVQLSKAHDPTRGGGARRRAAIHLSGRELDLLPRQGRAVVGACCVCAGCSESRTHATLLCRTQNNVEMHCRAALSS